MEKQWLADNERELARLKKLIGEINDEELQFVIYQEGWTIAVMLAHLAYWDLWSVLLMRKWKTSGKVKPIPVDWDTFNDELMPNDTILPFLLAIPPRTAANMAIGWAEAINHELEETTPEMIAEIERLGDETRLYRSIHRKMHLDEIETLLKFKRGNN